MKKFLILLCMILMLVLSSCIGGGVMQGGENTDNDGETVDVGGESIITNTPKEDLQITLLKQFETLIEENKTYDAANIYEELEPLQMTKANRIVEDKLKYIEENYYNGSYDYSTTVKLLDAYTVFDSVSSILDAMRAEIEENNQFDIALENAKKYSEKKDYAKALSELGKIDYSYGKYSEAEELTKTCVTNYRDIIKEKCEELIQEIKTIEAMSDYESVSDTYDEIFAIISEALTVLPKDTELTTLVSDISYDRQQAIKQYMELIFKEKAYNEFFNSDFAAKCEIIWSDNVSEYESLLKKYQNEFIKAKLADAKALADQKKFTDAAAELERAKLLFETTDFDAKIAEYNAKKPMSLLDHNIVQYYDLNEKKNVKDAFGNTYDYASGYWTGSGYAIYNLECKYTKLKAVICTTKDFYTGKNGTIKFYADDKLIKEFNSITRLTMPFEIEIDVTDCVMLKISTEDSQYAASYIYLANPMLTNE